MAVFFDYLNLFFCVWLSRGLGLRGCSCLLSAFQLKLPCYPALPFPLGNVGPDRFSDGSGVFDGVVEGGDFAQEDELALGAGDGGVDQVALEHAVAGAGDGKDDYLKLATLGLVDGHGIGQGNLVPFIAWIGDFATVEVDGNLVLLGVGVLGRQEVGNIAQVAIEDIGFGVVD